MARIQISEPHQLSQQEATQRVQQLLDELRTRFADQIGDLHQTWHGSSAEFSFKLRGFLVKGSLHVAAAEVQIEGGLPLLALPFRSIVEQAIRQQARQLLDA